MEDALESTQFIALATTAKHEPIDPPAILHRLPLLCAEITRPIICSGLKAHGSIWLQLSPLVLMPWESTEITRWTILESPPEGMKRITSPRRISFPS